MGSHRVVGCNLNFGAKIGYCRALDIMSPGSDIVDTVCQMKADH